MMKIERKLVLLMFLLSTMAFCFVGCSSGNEIVGIYSGTTGQTRGTRSSTLSFEDDGTCTYEYVHEVSYKGDVTEEYSGVWIKSEENDNYEIMLDGMPTTLYGKILDSGDIVISSDGYGWVTETFSKE